MATGNSGTAYDQITIQGKLFRVPIRYAVGHALTEGEASALNQTYHENLRNNFAKKVTEGLEAEIGVEVLQQQLDDYAQEYQFGVRTGSGGRSADPVTSLAMSVAREVIRDAIKEKNLNSEEWPASRVSQAAKALLDSQGEDGLIMQTARKSFEAERTAAKAAMEQVHEMLTAAR